MRKCILVLFFALSCITSSVWATHIVGGELSLTVDNINTSTYRLSLNLYFDLINGSSGARDRGVTAFIYRKQDNRFMQEVFLPLTTNGEIQYTNPTCSTISAPVRTDRMFYTRLVTLAPQVYNDAGGYYVVWERCCRNGTITNIFFPGDEGNTFYLEFPAVVVSNRLFVNSSPVFSVPKGDYVCANKLFTFDFGATDADGDKLRYSLVTPYSSFSNRNDPILPPSPGPYPLVTWVSPSSATTIIPGPRPLQIDSLTGQLSLIANRVGLYVFSVLCEEFRNGTKIGAVRRDFQFRVITCPENDPPVVSFADKSIQEGSTITVTAAQTDRCIAFNISDPKGNNQEQAMQIRIRPVNFSTTDFNLTTQNGVIRSPQDTIRTKICWGRCISEQPPNPLKFDVITNDDGCPQPLMDTLHVIVFLEPIPNEKPLVSTDLPNQAALVPINQAITFTVSGNDADKDPMLLKAIGEGFNLADVGVVFPDNQSTTGFLESVFTWTPDCRIFQKKPDGKLQIQFLLQDKDCPGQTDTIQVSLQVKDDEAEAKLNEVPNVFTPNGDNSNESFALSQFLPKNNCKDQFEKIEVYNRWGVRVYESTNREFSWNGQGFPAGIYYYYVTYLNTRYKGTVSLLR